MFTLIKKDLLVLRGAEVIALLILLLIMNLLGLSPYLIFMILSNGIVISLFIYDYTYKTNRVIKSLPVTINTLVISRYMSSLISMVCVLLSQMVIPTIIVIGEQQAFWGQNNWKNIVIMLCLGTIALSVAIAIFHLFQSIYISFSLIIGLFFISVYVSIDQLVKALSIPDGEPIIFNQLDLGYQRFIENTLPGQPYMTLICITLMTLILSYAYSLFSFKRKDLA